MVFNAGPPPPIMRGHFSIVFSIAVMFMASACHLCRNKNERTSRNVGVNKDSGFQTCINQHVDAEKAILRVSRLQTNRCFVENFMFCKSVSICN